MSDHRIDIRLVFPAVGQGYTKVGRNISYTKSGPGRRHKTGKQKKEAK